jgi:Ca-activated chloride channel family protein
VGDQAGIAKLWARERIGELTRLKNLGGDATEAEGQIVNLAIAHHLVSDYTSLVAVDVTPVRPVDAGLNSEQALTSAPRGGAWAQSSTGFASTATAAPLLMLLGVIALAVALLVKLAPAGVIRRVASLRAESRMIHPRIRA